MSGLHGYRDADADDHRPEHLEQLCRGLDDEQPDDRERAESGGVAVVARSEREKPAQDEGSGVLARAPDY